MCLSWTVWEKEIDHLKDKGVQKKKVKPLLMPVDDTEFTFKFMQSLLSSIGNDFGSMKICRHFHSSYYAMFLD